MTQKLKKIIKFVFGNDENLFIKTILLLFFVATLFLLFAMNYNNVNSNVSIIFSYISAILFAIWLVLFKGSDSVLGFCKNSVILFIWLIILYKSLYFCLISAGNCNMGQLVIYSILSCIGLLFCVYYIISKLVDAFLFFKKVIVKFKEKLFNSVQPTTSKITNFIENITALLVAIVGCGVAIKAIAEPLISLLK